MTDSIRPRLAVALSSLVLAAGGVVIAAPAAHADGVDCANNIASADPSRSSVDLNVFCGLGELPGVGTKVCNIGLTQVSKVSAGRADGACSQASQT
ncbi:hypothetical protein [Streptomyces albireticuli]|uniref:Secreted protein n=1 Tax=Streptomyces albireticuli TaxID=1940 RepID=A0A2A2DBE6_9ACTN|nr:hypothetical protein [Streptomyces albireticuli]MCD9145424.1 hypothetical protein [Streptomyces albireticuli]MCD9165011.1 hypothetical protein [Streptomyces albireticuli]MCD9195398.1 hypothetical protein [Streptomyces albireticuli]PAU48690.1 hypothetical protein CK936_11575 [Streptomyces albireticuli]